MRLSIRHRILLGTLLPITAICVVVMGLMIIRTRETARRSVAERMSAQADLYAAQFDTLAREAAQVARTSAAFVNLRPSVAAEEIYELLRANVTSNRFVYGAAMAFEPFQFDAAQRLFCPYVYGEGDSIHQMDIGAEAYDYTLPEWEWYHAPMMSGEPLWTDPYFDEGAGNILMCTFSVPFRRGGELWGITTIDIALEPLQRVLRSQMDDSVDFVVVTRDGEYVYHPDPHRIMSSSILEDAEQLGEPGLIVINRRLARGRSGVAEVARWDQDEPLWVFYAPIESTGWGFIARVSKDEALAPVRRRVTSAAGALILFLALATLCLLFVSARVTRPIVDLTARADRVRRGERDVEFPPSTDDEVGVLSHTIDAMVGELREAQTGLERRVEARTAELRDAREAAEGANRAKSEFLANMSHEIRTPMNAILGFGEILRQQSLAPNEKSYVEAICTSGKSLLTLINDILDLSKVEAGRLEIQHEPFSLRSQLEEIHVVFTQRAAQKGLALRLEIDEETPDWIFLDDVRLRQVVFNIVGNALKFTESGSVTIRAKGRIDSEQTDWMHLTLEVQDSGIGIPEEQRVRVFEAFQQVEGQRTRKYGGTGLGLAISRRLTEMMGGTITVESTPGVGSTFRLDFPTVLLAAEVAASATGQGDRLDRFEPATILCADDEPLNRQLLSAYFDGTEHTILLAENGAEAVEIALAERPDVILMDIRMPVMDGLEATKRIKAQMDIPILALTASSMKGDQRIIEEICDRHLSKPIALPDLARALRDYLQIKPMAEAPASTAASEVEESESAPSDEALARWPELAGNLRREHSDVWPRLCDSPNITEVEEFAARLGEWATEFEAAPLARYAHTLQQHVENFDVEGMMETLKTFEEIVAQIEAQVLR